jgi:enamine deaminase RidA (YjgF/YER057c/UK114 family)
MRREILTLTSVHGTEGIYSHAVRAGELLFIAGQVAKDRDDRIVGHGDIEAQARQVYANLSSILSECGEDLGSIVKMTTLLTDRRDLDGFRRVRDEVFQKPVPANTLMFVAGLAHPDYLIEVEAIATLDDRSDKQMDETD